MTGGFLNGFRFAPRQELMVRPFFCESSVREDDRGISVLLLHTVYVRASERAASSNKRNRHPDRLEAYEGKALRPIS
jgi:hypothetical protein